MIPDNRNKQFYCQASHQNVERLTSLIIFSLFLLSIGCNSKETKILARAGNSLITLDQFEEEFLQSKPIQLIRRATRENKKTFLEEMLDRQMRIQLTYQMGLDKKSSVLQKIDSARRRLTYIATLETFVMQSIISDEKVLEFYKNSGMEVRARHILLDFSPDEAEEILTGKMANAEDVIRRIRRGENFAKIASEISTDEFTAQKGGDLGFLKWGSMDGSFMEAALRTGKHQVYPTPVVSSKGLHIIQVIDRRKVPRKPFEFEKTDIIRRLFNQNRNEVMKEFDQFNQELDQKHGVVYFDDNIQKAIDYFKTKSASALDSLFEAKRSSLNSHYSMLDPLISDLELAKHDRGPLTVSDLLAILSTQSDAPKPSLLNDVNVIRKMLQDKIRFDLTCEIGFRKSLLENRKYKKQLQNQVARILINELKSRHIDRLEEITHEMMETYYADNLKKYKIPVRVYVQEVLVSDSAKAHEVYEMAIAGFSFDELVDRFNMRATTKSPKKRLGPLTENSHGEIGKNAVRMQPGEISPPLKTSEGFSVIKVLRREEEQIRSLNELESRVKADLRNEMRQKSRKQWESKMRERIPVRVYDEVLDLALQDFVSKKGAN